MATPHHPTHRQLTTSQPFRTIPLNLRPTDLQHFEAALVNQGVIHPFDPDTLDQRVHSLPTFQHHSA